MDFPPILILGLFWLLIGLPLSKLSKKAQQNAKQAKPGQGNAARKAQQNRQAPKAKPQAQPQMQPARPTVMQPTITVTEHDDSVYQGSLYAETGEGYDPCHDEQLSSLTLAESAAPAEETVIPGLQLSWTGSDVVRGLVMSEILNRRG